MREFRAAARASARGLGAGAALAVAAALAAGAAGAAAPGLAPIPASEALSTHGPFTMGECRACHQGRRARPGKVRKAIPELCFDCHEDFRAPVAGHPAGEACTGCHSPHNARKRKLLL